MRLLVLTLLAAAAVAEDRAPALPEDPDAVVVLLDDRGGFGPELPPEPRLEVLAGGTLKSYGKVVGKLSPEELAALVRAIVVDQRFFEWDAAKAEAKMGERDVAVLDASTTRIRVVLKDRKHEAKVYALGWQAQRYGKVDELRRLENVRRRLEVVRNVALAGGREKAEALLDLANKALAEKHPDKTPLTLFDLHHVGEGDGERTCRFHRAFDNGAYTSVFIKLPKEGEPVVEVAAEGPRPK